MMPEPDDRHRHIALRFLALTSPVYLSLYVALWLIRALSYDDFSDSVLWFSFIHIFGLQSIHVLLVSHLKRIDRQYIYRMLWFMVLNNILLFCYWLYYLSEARMFIYLLATMSTVALFNFATFWKVIIYNGLSALALAVSAYYSHQYHHPEPLVDNNLQAIITTESLNARAYLEGWPVGLDWIMISVYFIVSIWLAKVSDVFTRNRKALADTIKEAKSNRLQLEAALSELSLAHAQLEDLAVTDALTNVKNRRYFDQTFKNAWSAAAITDHELSLVMIDIDNFKQVNDRYGHQVGDQCLQHIAGIIKESLHRQGDEVTRYGGEEFAVILPHTGKKAAMTVAERIRSSVHKLDLTTRIDQHTLTLSHSISLGVATLSQGHNTSRYQGLVQQADQALYAAKEQGKNRVVHANGHD
jgi:diguanylate cyclase (GGDEF)-like protein